MIGRRLSLICAALTLAPGGEAAAQGSERMLRWHVRTAMEESALVRVTVGRRRAPVGHVTGLPDQERFVLARLEETPAWIRYSEVSLLERGVRTRGSSSAGLSGSLVGAGLGAGATALACRRVRSLVCAGEARIVTIAGGAVLGGILGWAVTNNLLAPGDPQVKFSVIWRGD
ncbi:MAG: hypothetical protein ABFS34_08565 [Gemmatimonadota bacterium]